MVNPPQAWVTLTDLLAPQTFKLFLAYPMESIPETRRAL